MFKRLLRLLSDLQGYPSQHVHRDVELRPLSMDPFGPVSWQQFLETCRVCGWVEVR